MKHTLGTAAKAVGKSKSTISKAISSGKISAHRLPNGSFEIDPSELHRVYPPNGSETGEVERSATPNKTGENTNENMILQVKLDAAHQRIADLEEDRAQWRQQANTLLLKVEKSQPEAKGFWKRLLGG